MTTITIPRALLEQALEALDVSRRFVYQDSRPQVDAAFDALSAELAKPQAAPEQEESFIPNWANYRQGVADGKAGCPKWHDAPEVAALKSEIERLRKDAERLDYIEESGNFVVTRYRSGPGGPVLIEAEDGMKDISKSASSLRDAIDSVIKEAK